MSGRTTERADSRATAQDKGPRRPGKLLLISALLCAGALMPVVTFAVADPAADRERISPAPETQDDIERVERYLEDIKSMTSTFIQRAPDGSVTEGKLVLERPGKLRFEYQSDVPLLIVSDGSTLTFVDYSVKQVTRWPISDTPLGVLVAKKIDLRSGLETTVDHSSGGLMRVRVVDPKRKDEGFITLLFETQPLALKAWDVTDAQGLETRVTLMDSAYNVDVSKTSFAFKDPRTMPLNRRAPR